MNLKKVNAQIQIKFNKLETELDSSISNNVNLNFVSRFFIKLMVGHSIKSVSQVLLCVVLVNLSSK